jgi:hypothetical protein
VMGRRVSRGAPLPLASAAEICAYATLILDEDGISTPLQRPVALGAKGR